MDWTKLLSFALSVLVVLLVGWSAVQLLGTTFAWSGAVTESIVTVGFVAVVILVATVVGVKSRRWIRNPDHYW